MSDHDREHERHGATTSERGAPRVVLLFPPLTEARLFPYLSLPMLAGYLARAGVETRCHDLNLRLVHRLVSPAAFRAYLTRATDDASLAASYRRAMAGYLAEHADELARRVFGDVDGVRGGTRELRLVNQGVELLLEGSVLKAPLESLAALDEAAREAHASTDDPGVVASRKLLDELADDGAPAILGISVAFYSQLLPALLLARWAKAHWPATWVVLGGPQIMLRAEELRGLASVREAVDALCVGPGEQALLELARATERGVVELSALPELLPTAAEPGYRPLPSSVHIRDVPPPDFRDFPLRRYVDEEPQLALITCVGCSWGRCTFCSYGARSRRRGYQQKHPRQLADECEALVTRHGIDRINFVDENTNLKLVVAAMQRLRARGVEIRFSVRNRFERVLLDEGFCATLARLGCVLMSIGYETNSQRLVDQLGKGVDVNGYQVIIDNLHRVGITLRLSVMGGILDETPQEVAASEAFLRSNAHKLGIDVMQMLVMEPGTPLAEHPERFRLAVVGGGRLRGNRRLNYGMGRMGAAFHHPDGDTFEARLERFVALHHAVQPGKNDASAPSLRVRHTPPREAPSLVLHPWVRVLEIPGPPARRYVADLVWESVYVLPDEIAADGPLLRAEGPARRRLGRLAAAELGEVAGTPPPSQGDR